MAGFVVLIVVLFIILMAAAIGISAAARQERASAMKEFADKHGLSFTEEDDDFRRQLTGKPFTNGGSVMNVVRGEYKGRPATSFSHVYTTTTSNGSTTTTTSHPYSIWILDLGQTVPEFSVEPEGMFGGRVAEFFGASRLASGDQAFDDNVKVQTSDDAFGRRVLNPRTRSLIEQSWIDTWRLSGTSMIAYATGQHEPDRVLPGWAAMTDLLESIPDLQLEQGGEVTPQDPVRLQGENSPAEGWPRLPEEA